MSWLFDWFSKTAFWLWFSRKVLPYMNFRLWGYPKYSMMNYYLIREHMRTHPDKVYVFVGVDRSSLSYKANHLITRCKWSHAGFLYLDYTGEVRMHHVTAEGYGNWSLLSYLREVDDFQLLTLPVPSENKERLLARIRNIAEVGADIEYDFSFEIDDRVALMADVSPFPKNILFYCSELVYIVGLGLVPNIKAHKEFGRKAFEPDDVAAVCAKVTLETPWPPT